MGTYNFDEIIERRGTYSVKYDVGAGELPMWVADMDFRVAPPIVAALQKRLDNGIFGYTDIPQAWREAYCNWWKTRHHWEMDAQRLIFCTGVVPAISSMVRKLTTPNENVVLQTPVYPIFFNSVVNNGARVLESPLLYDGVRYRMDFDDLEKKLADPQTTLMILCNPQNPTGQIWSKDELERVGHLCAKHHVTVISDEIHCDLTDPGTGYVPFASVDEVCARCSITCLSPTKAFNIAGICTSAVYAEDEVLHHKVWRGLNTDEVAEPNVFAVQAAMAAFNESGDWLDALRVYLYDNKQYVINALKANLPDIHIVPSQATYLLWLDVSHYTHDSSELASQIRAKTGLFVSSGKPFGGNGHHFLRVNIACPLAVVKEGMRRLQLALT